jgi:hypothetical protein
MDALSLLEEQHAEVDELLDELDSNDAVEARILLFAELADKVAAHATMEEALFYPAVMSKNTEEILVESVEEHLSVKRLLADLIHLDPEDESFDAKLAVMKEQLQHHAHEEEERELFPRVRKAFSRDELDALGGEMAALFQDLMRGNPRLSIPAETVEAAPLH